MGCGPRIRKRKTRVKREHTQKSIAKDTDTKSTILMPRIPQKCYNCGASINSENVNWTGPTSIECSFCGAILQVKLERVT